MHSPTSDNYDVLIVGAGAAGLAAGRALTAGGMGVAILEARDRIGGRIFTVHEAGSGSADVAIELGAEFVHGLPSSSWNLIREARLATCELHGSQLCFEDSRLQHCRHEHAQTVDILENMSCWLATQPAHTDLTFAQYLTVNHIPPLIAERAAAYVEGFNAADQNIAGIAGLARQQRAEDLIAADRLFHIEGGYEGLPRYLCREFIAHGGTLRLQHQVNAIRWRPGRVEVQGHDAAGAPFAFTARQMISTLPLGVLRAGAVLFTPAPHDLARQVSRMMMGTALRASLLFKTKFWSEPSLLSRIPALGEELKNLSFLFARGTHWPTWWTASPGSAPLITAWAAGPKAALLDGTGLINLAVADLAVIFGLTHAAIRAQMVAAHCHDWQADPFSRGSYSYVPAGGADASEHLSRPCDDTLFFAGEHTDLEGHWGTVHAALNTGLRAAAQLLRSH